MAEPGRVGGDFIPMTRPARCTALALPLALVVAACQGGEGPDPSVGDSAPPDTAVASPPRTGAAGTPAPLPPDAPTTSAQDSADAEDACGARKVAGYIGKEATVPIRSAVARESGADTDRWLYPDSMMTEDFSPTRLNVMLEASTHRIVSMRCG